MGAELKDCPGCGGKGEVLCPCCYGEGESCLYCSSRSYIPCLVCSDPAEKKGGTK